MDVLTDKGKGMESGDRNSPPAHVYEFFTWRPVISVELSYTPHGEYPERYTIIIRTAFPSLFAIIVFVGLPLLAYALSVRF